MNALSNKTVSLSLILLLAGAIFLVPFIVHAGAVSAWNYRNLLSGEDLRDATYGNSSFVAVGKAGTIATSSDGVIWSIRRSAITDRLSAIAYGDNTYVAVEATGAILSSPDGFLWTDRGTFGRTFTGVAYGYSRFIAVSKESDSVYSSADGISWMSLPSGSYSFCDVTYGNGLFVGISSEGTILTSPDGATWTAPMPGTAPVSLMGVVYGGGVFVAVGLNGNIYTSSNGVTWASPLEGSGTSNRLTGIAYGNGSFVAVGDAGTILASIDGGFWKAPTGPTMDQLTTQNIKTITFSKDTFWAIGDSGDFLTTSDPELKKWSVKRDADWNDLYAVTFGQSMFVAVGGSGGIITSPDGAIWTPRASGTSRPIKAVVYGDNRFVGVEGDSLHVTSEPIRSVVSLDGITWAAGQTEFQDPVSALAYGKGTYVASAGAAIYTSSDGVSWDYKGYVSGNLPTKIVYGDGLFVTLGAGGITASLDGMVWTTKNSELVAGTMTYSNGRFFVIADTTLSISSDDASTWMQLSSSMSLKGNAAVFGNNTLVLVGNQGLIVQSDQILGQSTVSLYQGWNFISFPVLPSLSTRIETALREVSPNMRIAWGFDNLSKSWLRYSKSMQYSTSKTLDFIEPGKGYWIYMDASGSIDLAGWAASSHTVVLDSGWNLVGYNGADCADLSVALSSIVGKWTIIWNWDKERWYAKHSLISALPTPVIQLGTFNIGKAYWIRMNQAAIWQQ